MIIPYNYTVDKDQNVTTKYGLEIDNCLCCIYKLHFYSYEKKWKIESMYVNLDIRDEFITFNMVKDFERKIKDTIPEYYSEIRSQMKYSKLNS